jgi:hypothetical protein
MELQPSDTAPSSSTRVQTAATQTVTSAKVVAAVSHRKLSSTGPGGAAATGPNAAAAAAAAAVHCGSDGNEAWTADEMTTMVEHVRDVFQPAFDASAIFSLLPARSEAAVRRKGFAISSALLAELSKGQDMPDTAPSSSTRVQTAATRTVTSAKIVAAVSHRKLSSTGPGGAAATGPNAAAAAAADVHYGSDGNEAWTANEMTTMLRHARDVFQPSFDTSAIFSLLPARSEAAVRRKWFAISSALLAESSKRTRAEADESNGAASADTLITPPRKKTQPREWADADSSSSSSSIEDGDNDDDSSITFPSPSQTGLIRYDDRGDRGIDYSDWSMDGSDSEQEG